MAIFGSTWGLLVAGLVFALPVMYIRIKNHTEVADEAMYVPPYTANSRLILFSESAWISLVASVTRKTLRPQPELW
jgi:ABC-type molybdate transport system permease subunit